MQRIFDFIFVVVFGEGVVFHLLETADILMGIEGVGLQLDEGQGDVRAVIGYALKVGEQVIENEALVQGTHTSLKAVDVVACAVSRREIGVDLEKVRPVHARLLRTLTDREKAWLESLAREEWDRAFLRLWTMKESWIKCRSGVVWEYKRCNFVEENGVLSVKPKGYNFTFPATPEGYVLTVCEKE